MLKRPCIQRKSVMCHSSRKGKAHMQAVHFFPSFVKEPFHELIEPITKKLDSIDKRLERIEHATLRVAEKSDGNYVKMVTLDGKP